MSQDPARLQRALQLFDDALDQPADTRDAWLAHACAGDAELLAQVQAMLAADAGGTKNVLEPDLVNSIVTLIVFGALLAVLYTFAWGPILAAGRSSDLVWMGQSAA